MQSFRLCDWLRLARRCQHPFAVQRPDGFRALFQPSLAWAFRSWAASAFPALASRPFLVPASAPAWVLVSLPAFQPAAEQQLRAFRPRPHREPLLPVPERPVVLALVRAALPLSVRAVSAPPAGVPVAGRVPPVPAALQPFPAGLRRQPALPTALPAPAPVPPPWRQAACRLAGRPPLPCGWHRHRRHERSEQECPRRASAPNHARR